MTVMVLASSAAKTAVPVVNPSPMKSSASAVGSVSTPMAVHLTVLSPLKSPVRVMVKVKGVEVSVPSYLSASKGAIDSTGGGTR